MKFAPAKKIHKFWSSNTSPASIFSKISSFEIPVSCATVAWQRITFLFGNARPWYFQRMKFKHIAAAWFQNFSKINSCCPRKSGPKTENSYIVQAPSCEKLPLLMQFLYGVTTLRDTCIENRGAARQWNSRQRRNLVDFDDQTPQQRQYFRKNRIFQISVSCDRLLVHV